MRCKVGDLAVIIGGAPGADANVGLLVRVEAPYLMGDVDEPSWEIRTLGLPFRGPCGHVYDFQTIGCYDRCLQPIRPPGTGAMTAADETKKARA